MVTKALCSVLQSLVCKRATRLLASYRVRILKYGNVVNSNHCAVLQVFWGIFFSFFQSKAKMVKPIFSGKYILTDIMVMFLDGLSTLGCANKDLRLF